VRKSALLTAALYVAALAVLAPRPAYAYLDPASGSMMLQLVLGGIAGLAVAFKLFWRKLRGFFGAAERRALDAAERRGAEPDPEPPGGA
jgi:hypothetical protein